MLNINKIGAKIVKVNIAALVELKVPDTIKINKKIMKHIGREKIILIFLKFIMEYIKKGILYINENAVILTFAAKPKNWEDLWKIKFKSKFELKNGK